MPFQFVESPVNALWSQTHRGFQRLSAKPFNLCQQIAIQVNYLDIADDESIIGPANTRKRLHLQCWTAQDANAIDANRQVRRMLPLGSLCGPGRDEQRLESGVQQ